MDRRPSDRSLDSTRLGDALRNLRRASDSGCSNRQATWPSADCAMAGADVRYRHLPFFYSDLFDLGYEAVGVLDPRLEVVADWKDRYRSGIVYYVADGRVRGVLAWGVFGKMDAARDLIAEAGPHDAATLRGRIPA